MIHGLVRQHALFRTLRRWLLLTLVNSLLMEGVRVASALRLARAGQQAPAFGAHAIAACVLWLPLAIVILVAALRPRCGQLHLALPLPARCLWRANTIVLAVTCGAVLALAAGSTRLYAALLLRSTDVRAVLIGPSVMDVLPAATACALLAVVLVSALRPAQHQVSATPAQLAAMGAIVAGAFLASVGLSMLPRPLVLGPVALALLLAWRTERSLPEAFELAPRQDRTRSARPPQMVAAAGAWERDATGPRGGASRRVVWASGFRVLHAYGAAWITLPMLLFYGALLTGAAFTVIGDPDERAQKDGYFIVWGLLTLFLLLTPLEKQMRSLYLLDALPISRRTLLALMLLPGLVSVALGVLSGEVLAALSPTPIEPAAGTPPTAAWFALVGLLIVVPYLLLTCLGFRLYAPGITTRARQVWTIVRLGAALLFAFGTMALAVTNVYEPVEVTAALKAAAGRASAALPGGSITAWLVSGLLMLASWRLVSACFDHVEAPLDAVRAPQDEL